VRLSASELLERVRAARGLLAACTLCGHRCGVDRTRGPAGLCNEGDGVFLAGAGLHFGEERVLVGAGWNGAPRNEPLPQGPGSRGAGRAGSALVLVGGCNLACRACETADFSLARRGLVEADGEQLAGLFLDLAAKGAANLNLVTPTHVLPALLDGLARARARGLDLPIVWNCGGYETREALAMLDGVVDVYLPDAKVGTDAAGELLLGCKGYPASLRESLEEMQRQCGPLALDSAGLAVRGVIVRHLVLPEDAADVRAVMRIVAEAAPDAVVNVMSQYRPVHEAKLLPVLSRRATRDEVQAAVLAGWEAGVRAVWLDGALRG
jgi:putative pyruvate formate lyase activating enzyme